MSAFRLFFCSFARVFKILVRDTHTHTHTHTGPFTLPLRKRGVTKRLFYSTVSCHYAAALGRALTLTAHAQSHVEVCFCWSNTCAVKTMAEKWRVVKSDRRGKKDGRQSDRHSKPSGCELYTNRLSGRALCVKGRGIIRHGNAGGKVCRPNESFMAVINVTLSPFKGLTNMLNSSSLVPRLRLRRKAAVVLLYRG